MSNQTRLKALMVKHNLRQEDVAKLILVSRQTVAKGLIQRGLPTYIRFSDRNLDHLQLALAAKVMEK